MHFITVFTGGLPHCVVMKLFNCPRADSQVQRIFSLDMASEREHKKAAVADTIGQMQARPGDTGSTTVQSEILTLIRASLNVVPLVQ